VDQGIVRGAVLQMMGVLDACLESRTVSRPQNLLTLIGHEHHLAFEDVDELILRRVPVALALPQPARFALR
jgi:hypothetical protein